MQPIEVDNDNEMHKQLMKDSMKMNILIFMIVFMVVGVFWIYPFHIYVRLGVTVMMLVSLYYQLMSYKHGIYNSNMIGMKVQERMINEMGYQVTKRGHKILFEYVKDGYEEKVKVKETDLSIGKRKLLKWYSFIHVLLKPAWGYREYDEEDEIDDVLNESYHNMDE